MAQVFVERISTCMLGELADRVPETTELDVECAVVEEAPGQAARPLTSCATDPNARPCWQLVEDLDQCGTTPTHLALEVKRDTTVSSATRVRVSCVTESTGEDE